MKKTRLTALILGGIMLCLTGIPALAADTAANASAATSSAPVVKRIFTICFATQLYTE